MSTGALIQFPSERRQPRRLVALPELIDAYGLSERWFRYRIAEGMPCHRFGQRALRFDPLEVERWLEGQRGAS